MTFPIRKSPCEDVLPAALPLADAVARLGDDARAVWPIARDGGALTAVAKITLRIAAQRGADGAIGDFADPTLVHPDEVAARAWLDADPRRAAAVAANQLTIFERDVPAIRAAVVMAGGLGSRLRPLTDATPKPLLEVGGRVLLFRILDALESHGVERVYVSINHLGDRVKDALDEGASWGFQLGYLEEDEPLDTGAGLALHPGTDEPFFVVNGDILTTLDFAALGRWHRLEGALATIATFRYPALLPYGVVHHDGLAVRRIEEKPVHRYDVNAGVYAFSPDVLTRVRRGSPLAMVDFLNALSGEGGVRAFPVVEYWNDIGTPHDFARAQDDITGLGL